MSIILNSILASIFTLIFSATAQFNPPIFKIVNSVTGQKLTANGAGNDVTLDDDKDDPSQKW